MYQAIVNNETHKIELISTKENNGWVKGRLQSGKSVSVRISKDQNNIIIKEKALLGKSILQHGYNYIILYKV
tara:strand:+ start:366 stop:581 length:216 start_codon:yes stop_codon:yes gene_type:complete